MFNKLSWIVTNCLSGEWTTSMRYHLPWSYGLRWSYANLELRYRHDISALHCPTSHGENSRFNSSIRLSRSYSKLINSLRSICVFPRCYMHRVRVWIEHPTSVHPNFGTISVTIFAKYKNVCVCWVHFHSFSLSYCISSRPLENQLPVVKSTLHGF